MENKKRFKEYMAGLGEIHDKKITPTLSEIYWKVLKPFSDDKCAKTFNYLISTCKFFPKPSEFLEILNDSNEDKSMIAWQEVMECLQYAGRSEDLTINKAVDVIGGWDYLRTQTYDQLKWTEKRFREHYQVITEQELIEYPENVTALLEPAKKDNPVDMEKLQAEALEYVRAKYGNRIRAKDKRQVEKEIMDFVRSRTGKKEDLQPIGSILNEL